MVPAPFPWSHSTCPSSSKVLPLTWEHRTEAHLTSFPGVSEKATRAGWHCDFKSSLCTWGAATPSHRILISSSVECGWQRYLPRRVPGKKDKCTCLRNLLCYRYCSRPLSDVMTQCRRCFYRWGNWSAESGITIKAPQLISSEIHKHFL